MLPTSLSHYRTQQRITAATVVAVRSEWAKIGSDFDAGWARVGPRTLALIVAGQLASAREGAAYVPRSLDETGESADAVGRVDSRAFAGYASDGRPLDSLLVGAVVQAKAAVGGGAAPRDALAQGGRWLDGTTWTQVADAGRVAIGVAIAVRPKVTGYVRVLNPPSCGRCAVLAGRWYRWSSSFQRHQPRCDCFHRPGRARPGDVTDPQSYFEGLSPADQDRLFGKAQSQAIRDGADMGQVVNASRSTYVAGGRKYTTVNTRGRRARMTPEAAYAEAGDDRDEAIRLLRLHGFVL